MCVKKYISDFQDVVKLRGEINYPNVEINPDQVNFGYLTNCTGDYVEIILKNISPLPVYFYWEWLEEYFEEEHLLSIIVSTLLFFYSGNN